MNSQRRTEVSRLQRVDKAQDILELVLREPQRVVCRRAGWRKRGGYILDLSYRRVRNAHIEGRKPLVPIRQSAQQAKRRCRANPVHPVVLANHMAAPAIGKGKSLSPFWVAFKNKLGFSGLFRLDGSEYLFAFNRKLLDRSLADIGKEPVDKALRMPLALGIAYLKPDVKNFIEPLHNRLPALGGKHDFTPVGLPANPDACFQRKPWQQEVQKARFFQQFGAGKAKLTLLSGRCQGQAKADAKSYKGGAKQDGFPLLGRMAECRVVEFPLSIQRISRNTI